jgi:hypothetical protein
MTSLRTLQRDRPWAAAGNRSDKTMSRLDNEGSQQAHQLTTLQIIGSARRPGLVDKAQFQTSRTRNNRPAWV